MAGEGCLHVTRIVLGRRRSSSQKRSIDTTDGRGEYKHLDLDDEIDGDDGDLTPAEVEAPADLAQRVANSKSKLYLESRIEPYDESGRVLESTPSIEPQRRDRTTPLPGWTFRMRSTQAGRLEPRALQPSTSRRPRARVRAHAR